MQYIPKKVYYSQYVDFFYPPLMTAQLTFGVILTSESQLLLALQPDFLKYPDCKLIILIQLAFSVYKFAVGLSWNFKLCLGLLVFLILCSFLKFERLHFCSDVLNVQQNIVIRKLLVLIVRLKMTNLRQKMVQTLKVKKEHCISYKRVENCLGLVIICLSG